MAKRMLCARASRGISSLRRFRPGRWVCLSSRSRKWWHGYRMSAGGVGPRESGSASVRSGGRLRFWRRRISLGRGCKSRLRRWRRR